MKIPLIPPYSANGNRIFQYTAAILANLGILCSEMHYGWTSHYNPQLIKGNYTFQISNDEASWITVIPLFGGILGALFTCFFVDVLGRKWLIVYSSLPFVASWLMVGLAQSSLLIFIGRFVAGIADGLSFTVVPMYLGEIAEAQVRGVVASLSPLLIVIGLLLINIFGAYLPLDVASLISVAPPALLLFAFPLMPESPYFYFMRKNTNKARTSLQTLSGKEDVSSDLHRIYMAVKVQNENKGSFLDLFTVKSVRKGMLVSLGLRSIQQLSGITVVTFYCKTVFEESREFFSPSLSTIIYFSLNLLVTGIATFIVDRFGRRPLLMVSITGTALSLFANGTYLYIKNCTNIDTTGLNFIPLAALFCYVIAFSIGLQTIPYFIVGELFPTNVKRYTFCAQDIYNALVLIFISKFFHWTNATYGMHVPFFCFAGCCITGLIFVITYVPETKGKTLEEIQEELCGKSKPANTKTNTVNVEPHGKFVVC